MPVDIVREASGWRPATPAECYFFGRRLLEEGRYRQAEHWLQNAIDEEPGYFWPHFALAVCQLRQGHAAAAVQSFEICVALRPEAPESYFNRGLARAAAGHTREAIEDLTRALEKRPHFAAALAERGVQRFRIEQFRAAARDFEGALRDGDDSSRLWLNLARARAECGDGPGARAALAAALLREPANAEAVKLRDSKRLEGD
jgi:tetratricopeptide (TPR) repeat protein